MELQPVETKTRPFDGEKEASGTSGMEQDQLTQNFNAEDEQQKNVDESCEHPLSLDTIIRREDEVSADEVVIMIDSIPAVRNSPEQPNNNSKTDCLKTEAHMGFQVTDKSAETSETLTCPSNARVLVESLMRPSRARDIFVNPLVKNNHVPPWPDPPVSNEATRDGTHNGCSESDSEDGNSLRVPLIQHSEDAECLEGNFTVIKSVASNRLKYKANIS